MASGTIIVCALLFRVLGFLDLSGWPFFPKGRIFITPLTVSLSPPQPLKKYCIIIRIILEVTQYSASPLGNDSERKVNINGIITCIVWLCARCCGSVVTWVVVIFCCTHMKAPTRIASNISGDARFIHRKLLLSGIAE
jgi:hypothetical protein